MVAQKWLIGFNGTVRYTVEARWRPLISLFQVYCNKERLHQDLNMALSEGVWYHFERDGHTFTIRPTVIVHKGHSLEVTGFELLVDGHLVATDRVYMGPKPDPISKRYNIPAIRKLLIAAFSDDELTVFCYDHFRPVADQFTAGQSKTARIQQLIDYAERNGLLEQLLNWVRVANPYQYSLFEAQLRKDDS